ncbi:GMC family oxidoreductase N-terminal domain-containing protein [[Mycobacterium] kokjensenii]|uniref:GMC family oxidoreductase N-terminal domain-containing protein n=1 Tax=[Mycobacterium] kokjensenii TaxID=3064287 RepID=A0ABM9LIE0_9MYCO|nr:GMC family oxidoreductase N-terminal domain-containing protein [Mycolicibacter sp. MU0083]CAJ1499572.1 GMC family oxidoreductase N-terminal domain-containing protein [Mycolicibacter sp. MU0083]
MSYDYVVVGGGTAGSVLAARLSQDPDVRVLLVEAGGASPPSQSGNPPDWPRLLHGTADWGVPTTVQTATGTSMHLGRGRGIGGSSVINAMVFARGHRDSYADWSQFGAVGWSFDDLLPYLMRSETAPHGDPDHRGRTGPLRVAPASSPHPVLSAGLSAAEQVGYRRATDVSSGLEIGFGPTDLTIADRRRISAADAYLIPALSRPNLEVVTEALVHRVLLAGGRALGVEYRDRTGEVVQQYATREVVVSAGGIGSPQLLMLSGIGAADQLRSMGIDVVANLPAVGANLQDHALTGLVYRAAQPLPPAQNNHGEVLGLIQTTGDAGAPDLQIILVDSATVIGLDAPDTYLVGFSAIQPFSRGTVRLAGPEPDLAPVVDPNYLADERDMRTMLHGLSVAREIGAAPALDGWRGAEISPGPTTTDETALREYIKATASSYFHPVGTCALGETDQAVVDSALRVRGVTGLRVVDASVMPSLPSNNPLATVYGIAERGAELLLAS